MAYKPDKHGRDHCPGGEDPLPCLSHPWVRLKQLDVHQEWSSTDSAAVVFDNIVYSIDPVGQSYFLVGDIGPDTATIQPMKPGLYQTTFRAYLDVTPIPFPADGFEISFVNGDIDQWDYYSTYVQGDAKNNSGGGYAELTFRAQQLDLTLDAWNPLNVQIATFADAMQLQDNGGGTYWEMRYLGYAETPRGLDNQNPE